MATPSTPSVNLNLVLEQVAKDKGIDKSVLVATLEDAMQTAAKKHFGQDRSLEAKYDTDKGVVELFQAITVVEEITDPHPGGEPAHPGRGAARRAWRSSPATSWCSRSSTATRTPPRPRPRTTSTATSCKLKTFRRGFGRIAAQTAKQVILQRTRDAERENVFNEYKDRKNEIVTGIARRFERGNIIVDLGRAEAVLPVREQVPRETYRAGDRVQAYVLDVLRESKGPQIILSPRLA